MPLSATTDVLAATCRRLLAETAADAALVVPRAAPGRSNHSGKAARPKGSGKHTGFGSWVIIACVAGVIALYVYSTAMHG
ncbi:hypothetical protein [Streptomyces sp. NPDC058240]|uniref:hypothetical protein n=1 Tax=Streptomyces sp. NPDC058240 TaxID=3346396 RepID=UPI0036E498E4